jgi:alcohol dehydrogenase, propanol-preferring
MKAWVIHHVCNLNETESPLEQVDFPNPEPHPGELLVRVLVCGVCHTELDEIEGRTPPPVYPIIPGHQVVGVVEHHLGRREDIKVGDRVGVAWIYNSCGKCEYCLSGQENLCADFVATGRDVHGGYAEFMVVPEQYVYKIPHIFSNEEAAPLLCAGAIGFRSLRLAQVVDGDNIGLTGFGASAHLVLGLLLYKYPATRVFVFARNENERNFAMQHGASWAGNTDEAPPELLDSIIDTTPVWFPVVKALEALKPGGRLVINAIRKERHDIEYLKGIDYSRHLWMEKEIKSVANVTRYDVEEFIRIAAEIPLKPDIEKYNFEHANKALIDIKRKHICGAKVLIIP